ncbi:MAG: signal recognition particle-docking protein FtsY [Acidobacteria bacterium]|nr:signal recognition particle-docking protein FtsY [Acidobacteriota bacterium]
MLGRFRDKLVSGLKRTREAIADRIGVTGLAGRTVDEALLDNVEEALIAADLGPVLAAELRGRLGARAAGRNVASDTELLLILRDELLELLPAAPAEQRPELPPRVTLVVGVNGSGKTTTVGKLAALWARSGRGVVVAAADTFRAAAVEQLVVWAERAGARVVRALPNSDPAAVAFDAARAGRARAADEVLVDTAGRLHTKKPLMDELAKISRAVGKEIPGAPHESLLVMDATVGLNAVPQAREFSRAAPVTGLVLTKLDGTARGGGVVAVGRELGLPVRYIGVGEGPEDLLEFDAREFVSGLLGLDDGARGAR